jgi:hypothetical protein
MWPAAAPAAFSPWASVAPYAGADEHRRECDRKRFLGGGRHQSRAFANHFTRVSRTAHTGDPTATKFPHQKHGRRHSLRRDKTLGEGHHGCSVRQPAGPEAAHDHADLGRWHAEQNVVGALDADFGGLNPKLTRQLDAR